MRNGPTGNVNRLDEVEGQYKGNGIEARMNHLLEEMEEVRKLRKIGKYSGRHKGEGEKEQYPRCTYERHEAGQKCMAEERTFNTCGDRGHFGMSKLCRQKKKKAARQVKKEQKETTSKSRDSKEEKNWGVAWDEWEGQEEELQAHHGGGRFEQGRGHRASGYIQGRGRRASGYVQGRGCGSVKVCTRPVVRFVRVHARPRAQGIKVCTRTRARGVWV